MAKILGNYGAARESAYFKVEQEAELQNHRKRLIKEGKLAAEDAQRRLAGESGGSGAFTQSEHVFEVLPEVLQQEARVEVPDAAKRKEFERRVRGEPYYSPDELQRYRGKLYTVGAAVGHMPRMSFGRSRYDSLGLQPGELVPGARPLSPQAVEVASRTYVAGVRALVYGSLLGALGLAAVGSYMVHTLDIHSGEDLRRRVQGAFEPLQGSIQGWVSPVKAAAQAWLGDATQAAAAPSSPPSELQRKLASRYNPRKAAEAAGEGGGAVAPGGQQ